MELRKQIEEVPDLALLTDEDVIILSSETSVSIDNVKLYIRAIQIFKELNFENSLVDEHIIFALLSEGMSVNLSALFTRTADDYTTALTQAAKKNILPFNIFYNNDVLIQIVIDLQKVSILNATKTKEGEFALYDIFRGTSF